MTGRDQRSLEDRLQAAFDRYNRAVMSGLDPALSTFIEALEAEGLRLDVAGHEAAEASQTRAPVPQAGSSDRRSLMRFGRRAGDRLPDRVRGLP
jgi:hypothetical protein